MRSRDRRDGGLVGVVLVCETCVTISTPMRKFCAVLSTDHLVVSAHSAGPDAHRDGMQGRRPRRPAQPQALGCVVLCKPPQVGPRPPPPHARDAVDHVPRRPILLRIHHHTTPVSCRTTSASNTAYSCAFLMHSWCRVAVSETAPCRHLVAAVAHLRPRARTYKYFSAMSVMRADRSTSSL